MPISLDTLLYLESGRQGGEPDLIDRLKERAVSARAEGNMTARCDADHFDQAAALIASQARRIEELEAFYRAVAHAAGDLDQLPDSHAFEVVWCHSDEDGNPAPGDPFITAGMIRRASRAILNRGDG